MSQKGYRGGFLKNFVILLLMEKADCIGMFINEDLGDNDLPFLKQEGTKGGDLS